MAAGRCKGSLDDFAKTLDTLIWQVYSLKAAERAALRKDRRNPPRGGLFIGSGRKPITSRGEGRERPAVALIPMLAWGWRYWIESLILAQDKRWRRA